MAYAEHMGPPTQLILTGMLIMAFNVYMTVKRREAISHSAPQAA